MCCRELSRVFAAFAVLSGLLFRIPPSTAPGATGAAILDDDHDPNWWHEYQGDIGGKLKIGLTLRFNADGRTAFGNYYYAKYCKDIRIEAEIKDRAITIREFDVAGNPTGIFRGEFAASDPRNHFTTDAPLDRDVIAGTWSKPDGSASRDFYLCSESATYSSSNRYAVAGFDDDAQVDRFVSEFRNAVLAKNRERVADMVSYPIKASVTGKRAGRVVIHGRDELIQNFDKIFTEKYLDRMRDASPVHMFCRDQGVMLGNGEVWVAPIREKQENLEPKVIAINNGER